MRQKLMCIAIIPLLACTPLPPVAYDGFTDLTPEAITVVMGPPLVTADWDAATGPITWRREIREYHQTPRRVFRKGRFIFDDYTTHEFLLTCDLTAMVSNGRVISATLAGVPRACDAIREDAVRVSALIDVLQDEIKRDVANE